MSKARQLSVLPDSVSGMRNRIINGGCVIDQRNAGASTTPSGAGSIYTVDRFYYVTTVASKFAIQQNAGSVTPPIGFSNYLGFTSQSAYSSGSTDQFGLRQPIEGLNIADLAWGTSNAKTVTLSFQVYSSLTGTFSGSIYNSAANRCYVYTYTVSSANTWTSVSVTIAGDTTGTWLSTNGIGMVVQWNLGNGSTYLGTAGSWGSTYYAGATGSVSVVGTNGATFYITGVQLEKGSVATSFDYRPYGTELALCQRYCETCSYAFVSMTNGGYGNSYASMYPYKVVKRATPTVTVYPSASLAGTAGQALLSTGGTNTNQSVFIALTNSEGHNIQFNGSGAYSIAQYSFLASAEL